MAPSAGLFMSNGKATIRSSIYGLLSRAFRYPSPEFFEACRSGAFLSELRDNVSRLPYLQSLADDGTLSPGRFQQGLDRISFRNFEVGYTQTFDVGAPKPPCPPYEGLHRQGVERTHLMVEISEFYKHFGLSMSSEEGKRELPDHLSAELEFLHFLTFKEAQAMHEGTPDLLKGYVLAQRDFLDRHLVGWLPRFCEKLERSTKLSIYSALAGIARSFVDSDLTWTHSRLREMDQP